MSSEWKEVSLNEVGQIVTGKTPPSTIDNAYADDGIPFITPKDMTGARFVSRAERHLSKVGLTAVKNNIVPADSVAVSCIGSDMGKSVLLKSESVTNQQINTIIVDQTKFDPKFIYYVLSTKQQDFKNLASGSATPILNKGHFGKVVINTPKIANQKAISSILDPIDSKIELNRQTNQTLEQIAQALFKSWFVDFEPTRAKIAAKEAGASPEEIERAAMCAISGKTPEQLAQLPPETQQNLKTTAALFPDALVDSELGEMPEGWEVLPLNAISEIVMGQSPSGDSYNEEGEGELLINGPVEFGEYHPKKIKWTTSPTKFSSDKDLIVCVRGSTTGRYVKSDGKYCLGRGVCAIRSKYNQQAFVDQLFKHCLEKLLTQATGSTFPSWNGPVLKSYKVNAATNELRTKYSSFVQEFESQISLNAASIQDLSNLRDSLLPKLLSGELHLDLETT